MFLLPQHFQQQDRHVQHLIDAQRRSFTPHAHGLLSLKLDSDLLAMGQVALLQAEGYLNDGTYFQVPEMAPAPENLIFQAGAGADSLHLVLKQDHWQTLQLRRPNAEGRITGSQRWALDTLECSNIHEPEGLPETIEVGQLQLEWRLGSQGLNGYAHVQVAQTLRCNALLQLELNPRFIPPALKLSAHPYLLELVQKVWVLLNQKIRLVESRRIGRTAQTAELADYLLLQTTMRHRLLLQHHLESGVHHPEVVYRALLQLLGDVELFCEDHSLAFGPNYQHDDLQTTFERVVQALERLLQGLSEQRATQIELVEKQFGVRLGQVGNLELFDSCYFVLAVHSPSPLELILREFPATVKLAPPDRIREVVNLNLPAVALRHLPHPPRELPFYAEHVYFKLDTAQSTLWQAIAKQGKLALHYAGPLPDLTLELWAIRRDEVDA